MISDADEPTGEMSSSGIETLQNLTPRQRALRLTILAIAAIGLALACLPSLHPIGLLVSAVAFVGSPLMLLAPGVASARTIWAMGATFALAFGSAMLTIFPGLAERMG